MPSSLPFYQVDVFTLKPYKGNPVAVVVALDPLIQLTEETMAQFSNWTNLSETTFLLPPTDASLADYKVRIFTTHNELPFAGHPTIGTCKVFLEAGYKPKTKGKIIQECQVDDSKIKLACSACQIQPDSIIKSEWIVNGPDWFALQLKDANAVLDMNILAVDQASKELEWGVWGFYPKGKGPDGADLEVRTFGKNLMEDPATGSFAAGLAVSQPSLAQKGGFVISQGTRLGRQGRIHVEYEESGKVWVGGHATVCISGSVHF